MLTAHSLQFVNVSNMKLWTKKCVLRNVLNVKKYHMYTNPHWTWFFGTFVVVPSHSHSIPEIETIKGGQGGYNMHHLTRPSYILPPHHHLSSHTIISDHTWVRRFSVVQSLLEARTHVCRYALLYSEYSVKNSPPQECDAYSSRGEGEYLKSETRGVACAGKRGQVF